MPPTNSDSTSNDFSLPVVQTKRQRKVRASRMSKRRAIVLGLVQIGMIAHLVQWFIMGTTITPIEPSESIETITRGFINFGVIFFSLALIATFFLGRWVCGWGCHIVMLQDLCTWLMKRAGIQPKPFRSRLLGWIPLVLALYMFGWPAVYRWVIAPRLYPGFVGPTWEWHLTTDDYWRTFASVGIAIPFLLICGFATVYFLGNKGFCTYGCPYGGFFAPLDRFAVARIRVNENCDQSGHCTAACSSNVRVHEEVRDFGMVVDPGCMKCLDCVSVCPNDALSFSFGRPALLRIEPNHPRKKHQYDLTWMEEIGFSIVFISTFFAFRSLYGLVPLLMAVGMALSVTFLLYKARRMFRDGHVRLHRWHFRRNARTTGTGRAFLIFASVILLGTIHSGIVQYHRGQGQRLNWQIRMPREAMFTSNRRSLAEPEKRAAAYGIAHLRKADHWKRGRAYGGIGVLSTKEVLLGLARLHLLRREYAEAETYLHRAVTEFAPSDVVAADLGRVMVIQGRTDDAIQFYRDTLDHHPEFANVREFLMRSLRQTGHADEAEAYRIGPAPDPTDHGHSHAPGEEAGHLHDDGGN